MAESKSADLPLVDRPTLKRSLAFLEAVAELSQPRLG